MFNIKVFFFIHFKSAVTLHKFSEIKFSLLTFHLYLAGFKFTLGQAECVISCKEKEMLPEDIVKSYDPM
jgi:hypothetical protein